MTKIPRPGQAARGSQSGEPIMALLDLLGRRWTLRIIWELRGEDASLKFRDLQSACGAVSSSVLNQRLAELRAAGVVDTQPGGYALTDEGRKLIDLYAPLNEWASRWARRSAASAQA